MNFLDPDQWKDLEALSKHYEELTDELVKELHGRLKPYFLRRIKAEVLQLPPKVRPIDGPNLVCYLTWLLRTKSLFQSAWLPCRRKYIDQFSVRLLHPIARIDFEWSHTFAHAGQNLDILRSLAEGNSSSSKGNNGISKTNMNNMLMQLRK